MKFIGPLGTVEVIGVAGIRFSVTLMDVFAHPIEFGLDLSDASRAGVYVSSRTSIITFRFPDHFLGPHSCRHL